jgi:hypothetical protein
MDLIYKDIGKVDGVGNWMVYFAGACQFSVGKWSIST